MARRSDTYWRERAEQRMTSYLRDSDETLHIIGKAFETATSNIQADIDRIFANYAKRQRLTPEEAKEYLSQPVSHAEYERLLGELPGVTDPIARRDQLARINAPSAAYRMNRLQAIQGSIAVQLGKVTAIELTASTASFQRTIREAYGKTLFDIQRGTRFLFQVDAISPGQVQEILRNPWSGMHYSERIWKNQRELQQWLEGDLTAGMMQGRSSAQMARGLSDKMGAAYRDAERLVRTETTYMANAAEMQSYKEAGIDRYRFVATLDSRTSEICQEHDGDVFYVDDAVPGKNMPPLHARCRSTTICYIDDEALADMRRWARDPVTGKTQYVPANMTYEDWIGAQKALHGEDTVNNTIAAQKHVQRKAASDRRQWERYMAALPDQTPVTLSAFRSSKYAASEAGFGSFADLQSDYRKVMKRARA